MTKIKSIPEQDRPREKLNNKGVSALTDQELVAVLLGSGNKNRDVFSLASRLLSHLEKRKEVPVMNELAGIPGIGPAKASIFLAAIEFGRRRFNHEGSKIKGPSDVLPLVGYLADRKQEHFICISLNGAHEVIESRTITVGLLNASQIHPREIFSDAIKDRAAAIIAAHNHPSGDLSPSKEDRMVTRRISEAGKTLGIPLLDHIIFGKKGYYSFKEDGALE